MKKSERVIHNNPDKDDVETHGRHLTDNRRAALTIIRNISRINHFAGEKDWENHSGMLLQQICEQCLPILKRRAGEQGKVGCESTHQVGQTKSSGTL